MCMVPIFMNVAIQQACQHWSYIEKAAKPRNISTIEEIVYKLICLLITPGHMHLVRFPNPLYDFQVSWRIWLHPPNSCSLAIQDPTAVMTSVCLPVSPAGRRMATAATSGAPTRWTGRTLKISARWRVLISHRLPLLLPMTMHSRERTKDVCTISGLGGRTWK